MLRQAQQPMLRQAQQPTNSLPINRDKQLTNSLPINREKQLTNSLSHYMFQQSTLDFLAHLKANNNKDWFEKNRKAYDAARADQYAFIAALGKEMHKWDDRITILDPKKHTMRINRDIRFSKDKSPYKSSLSFHFSPSGDGPHGGYYFHLEPGATFVGGGLYALEPDKIKAVRQEIDYNLDEFSGIMNNKGFKKYFSLLKGDALKTAPKDYPKDHPGIEWLKHKDFIVSHHLSDAELLAKDLIPKVNDIYKTMQPFMVFMDRAIGQ